MPGGNFIHCTGVRARVVGQGNLIYTLYSFDKLGSQALVPVPLNATDRYTQFRLSNFKEERMFLRGEVNSLDEYFKFNDITLYVKPLWTQKPA